MAYSDLGSDIPDSGAIAPRRKPKRKAPKAEIASPSQTGTHAYISEKATARTRKRKVSPPDDFDSEYDFLNYVRTEFSKDLDYDRKNREEMVKDMRFLAGDQWEDGIIQKRRAANKPTLTINLLPAYIEQQVGNRRMTDVGIKVVPDLGGTRQVAQIREGLIRNIQKTSKAQYVYDKAYEQQVSGGLGNFQLLLDYAHDDVFYQDIRIVALPNPLAVIWDRASVDPTGADAERVFVVDNIPVKDFRRRWPLSNPGDFDSESSEAKSGWNNLESNQVVSFWRIRCRTRTIAMMVDGSVMDVTDIEEERYLPLVMGDPSGELLVRDVERKYAQMYLCSGNTLLEGPYELPIQRVPVFRVPGWELFIEGDRLRWGMVRFGRDPQKLYNYWRSVVAEKLTSQPKAKWLASDKAVEGYEKAYRESHISDDPLLKWSADAGIAPQRVGPVEFEPALLEQAGVAAQDIKDVLNVHEASLGMTGNEVSGRAIQARQRVTEVGKFLYQDILNMSIAECGEVINQLIPTVYDTPRIIKILGEDMQTEKQVPINFAQEENPASVDITIGKYSISITTGPSYMTRRVEAREEMMGMANAMPDVLGVAADLIIEAQDWPGSDKIAKRMRSQLPPGLVGQEDMTEEELQQIQSQQEAQQKQQEIQDMVIQLEMQSKQVEIALNTAKIKEAEARSLQAEAQAMHLRALIDKVQADIEKGDISNATEALKTTGDIEIRQDEVEIKRFDAQTKRIVANKPNNASRS